MKVTWSWLADWTALPDSPETLAHGLAMLGFPVESLEKGRTFDPAIVVGLVLEANPHPNADRLRLCRVDVGSGEPLQIVCGAANVAAGQRVAVAQVGSSLPDGMKLRRAKIRGVESMGMICSERELGLSDESQGIWVLPGEPAIGTPLSAIAGGGETILDVEITSNRTDCMSVRGIAREIAASAGGALQAPKPLQAGGAGTSAAASSAALPRVSIESPDDCPRYMARMVRGVSIGPSPEWLRRRLEATGFRAINNVVDATNYVLREYGQPIHAFDAAKIGGNEIRVRRARERETLVLLDGRDMALDPRILVIADASRPMALAGIMGGLGSGVTDVTKDVVLESAHFDALLTKGSARALGVDTDAADRFAQGVDPAAVALALDATARLLAEIAGGDVVPDLVDQWPGRRTAPTLSLRRRRLERLLGFEVSGEEIVRSLRGLEIESASAWRREGDDEIAEFRIPPHRHDLVIEEDLIEEVARMRSYDSIPLSVRSGPLPTLSKAPEENAARRLRDFSCGLGFDEAISTVLVGVIPSEAREGISDADIWELQNPISRELKHLRPAILPALVRAAGENLRHGVLDVRLVEIGKVFRATPPPTGREWLEATLVLAGHSAAWDAPGAEPDRLLELKGALEAILEAFGIDSWETRSYHDARWAAGTAAEFVGSDGPLGIVGEVSRGLAEALGVDRPVWAATLSVAALAKAASGPKRYREVPRFPASKRDLAVMISRHEVTHEDLHRTIRESGGPLLAEARLFDLYRMGKEEGAPRSLAFALEFRASDRTLTDAEVDEAVARIVKTLGQRFGATLRGAGSAAGSKS
ncbi:MAG TPA: phenylalanine--tRNA ligase subunit beta [Candidatus Eisenbacteria bacterium]|nr:phenylalanine--tRNA ligase subunit beta [Candidatus Eisenbacteria bacterium]